MKFKFESSFVGFGSPKTTMEFEVDQLDDVLGYFKNFLSGCGYEIDGELEIVPVKEYYTNERKEVDMDGRC
jgi:hypothetical protein